MSDSFTETTSTSWFTRIKNALSGIVTGFILVAVSILALFWNEGRAVNTASSLSEGIGLVVTIDPAKISGDLNGKLVHFSGVLKPEGIAEDSLFVGVQAPKGATRLRRKVEMYQWKQSTQTKKTKKIGGSEEKVTTYSYTKVWSEGHVDSGRFKQPSGHENPEMAFKSETFSVENGTIGAVTLAGSNFSYLGNSTDIVPDDALLSIIKRKLNKRGVSISGNHILIGDGASSTAPQIGNMRISFVSGDVETMSVIGKLEDGKIKPFATSNGRRISMFRAGNTSAKEMFDDAVSSNSTMTWGIRLVGFLAMLAGFKMIFSIVGVLGDLVPFIGDVFRFATGMAAFALASVISTLVIGIAWIYYRPLIGIAIIVAGIILAVAALALGKAKARKRSSMAPEIAS